MKGRLKQIEHLASSRRNGIRLQRAALSILAAVFAAIGQCGCTIPDVAPFAEATVSLRQAVIATGDITIQAMRDTPQLDENDAVFALGDPQHPANRLQQAWSVRLHAMDVLTGYSDSLAQITSAAGAAEDTAQGLVDSVRQLSTELGAAGLFSDEAGALVELLASHAIKLKAVHNLREAILRAHPIVTEIAHIIKRDLQALDIEFASQSLDLVQEVRDRYGPMSTYRADLAEKLKHARNELDLTDSATIAEIEKIEDLLASTDREHEDYVAELNAAQERRQSGREAFRMAVEAIDRWITAHADLALAVTQNRKPNVRLLLSTIEEIKVALDNVKKSR